MDQNELTNILIASSSQNSQIQKEAERQLQLLESKNLVLYFTKN